MSETTIIEPRRGWHRINVRELFEYRELVVFLAWRDIMAQYKQAFFGVAWAVVKPVFSVLVFTLVFNKVARLSSSGLPYPVFTLCGVVCWSLFSSSLSQSTVSLLNNKNLITKTYFPRLIIPIAGLGRGMVDFVISFVLLILLIALYGLAPSANIWCFPVFIGLGLCITLGIGLFFSALATKYHDLKFAIPFVVQMWFWITPVAYGVENIPSNYAPIFFLNPMTWIIQGFRWSILGVGEMNWGKALITGAIALVLFFGGLFYFRRMESEFADII